MKPAIETKCESLLRRFADKKYSNVYEAASRIRKEEFVVGKYCQRLNRSLVSYNGVENLKNSDCQVQQRD